MSIFLGLPPPSIEAWIKENYKPTPTNMPLCFTAQEDGSSVSLICWNVEIEEQIDIFASLQYSTDNSTWQEWDGHIINLNAGQKVYIKALNPNPDGLAHYQDDYGDVVKYHKFIFEGVVAATGNIQYLLEDAGSRTDVPAYCFHNMFQGCSSLTQAPALPATTLASYCYRSMFSGCTGLTSAPELPATTLADNCYNSMFQGCSSLTQAPDLPATTLASYCYSNMFQGCSSLTQAPALPATTLAGGCYNSMFQGCSSLTQAPALPATTLASYCYRSMFSGCTGLISAPELPATTLANQCYYSMFFGCSQFSECRMKTSMEGVYNPTTHGNTTKTVIYDL